jgi:hypothetical protein
MRRQVFTDHGRKNQVVLHQHYGIHILVHSGLRAQRIVAVIQGHGSLRAFPDYRSHPLDATTAAGN